jgi:hypothetical protein
MGAKPVFYNFKAGNRKGVLYEEKHVFCNGTYTMNGTTASLRSTKYNVTTGTAVLVNSNRIRVTLNSNSIAPGTYTLTRQ